MGGIRLPILSRSGVKKFCLVLVLFLLSWSQATDYDFYGWSPDGRYLAFAQHSFGGDGDETAYTELFIIDSQKNSIIQRYYKLADQPGEGRVGIVNMLSVYRQATPLLNQLGIIEKRLGIVIWNKQAPDMIIPDSTAVDAQSEKIKSQPHIIANRYFSALNGQWKFHLAQIPYGTKMYKCPLLANYTRGFLLELIRYKSNNVTETTILQQDNKRVPKSRACTFHYDPVEVRVQGDYIAVALAVYRAGGFEDNVNRNFIVVTGRKPRKAP